MQESAGVVPGSFTAQDDHPINTCRSPVDAVLCAKCTDICRAANIIMRVEISNRLLSFLRFLEQAVATAAFALMVVVAAADVALREFTGQGLDGAREAAVLLMVVLVLTGFGLATASGRQLRPRFADGLVPQHWQPGLKRVADVLTALIYLLLAIIAAVLVSQSIALGEQTPVLRLPSALIQAALPLAFATGALRHLVFAVHPNLRPVDDLMLVAPGREKEA